MRNIELTSSQHFAAMTETIYACSSADHVRINFSDSADMTTCFANNQVIQNVAIRRPRVAVQVAFGKKVGRSRSDKLDEASLKGVVRRAEQIARVTPEDPEYMKPLGRQSYDDLPTHAAATAEQQPRDLAEWVRRVTGQCRQAGCEGAGIVTANRSHVGVSSNHGLHGFEARTAATFSLTATLPDSTGWVMNTHRDFDRLSIQQRAGLAVDKARASAAPRELPPGHYEVILEPAAVAGLIGPLIWALDAKDYHKGNSPYAGKLNETIFDERLWIQSEPDEDALLGTRFDGQGMPYRHETWVEKGVLKKLMYDRYTASQHGKAALPSPNAVKLRHQDPTAQSTEELIRDTSRGILVTNFWYIRYVNPADLMLTGMTRDGTFLIEDGRIAAGIKNFRWHDSPLRVLRTVAGATAPQEAVTNERGKMLLPTLKLPDFQFSSATRF